MGMPELLLVAEGGALGALQNLLFLFFVVIAVGIILFVLFRHTDSAGLGGAFGGGAVGGEGAFGAKGHKVADKVIAWMCGLFVVLCLLLAHIASQPATVAADTDLPRESSTK